ncbi:MAG TPA: shikimate dehydrogenase [Saprospiraceae bacterium]|nr:shikimate dehydrogenase [Saprospiraceae bacterium]
MEPKNQQIIQIQQLNIPAKTNFAKKLRMRLFGLIGYPLGHSFSQKYFSEKFAREGITDARYELFPLENIAGLPALLPQHPDLRGLNVTIPHKETVIPMLDELDETARAVGAVNCIKIEHRRLKGYNTDVIGFEQSLKTVDGGRWTVDGTQALILGTGGASKAVAYVLKKLGIPFQFVSRNPGGDKQISYETLHRLPSTVYRLIIHTTPLGMAPHTDTCPDLPFEQLTPQHLVYDLVYNPSETLLLQRAKAQGCPVKNGLEMLHLQAEAAWNIWQHE